MTTLVKWRLSGQQAVANTSLSETQVRFPNGIWSSDVFPVLPFEGATVTYGTRPDIEVADRGSRFRSRARCRNPSMNEVRAWGVVDCACRNAEGWCFDQSTRCGSSDELRPGRDQRAGN